MPFVPFLLALYTFFRAVRRGLQDKEFRGILLLVGAILLGGTFFYALVEGWSLIDAFYFSVITLTTVGYGDLSPTTPGSRLFTAFYILMGIGLLVVFIERMAHYIIVIRNERHQTTPESES
jgi:voltage-gated potassium channel